MAIEGSPLHRRLEERWRNHARWPEVLQQLNIADQREGLVNHHGTSINSAMTWANSPQGADYWGSLSTLDHRLTIAWKSTQPKVEVKKYAAEYH